MNLIKMEEDEEIDGLREVADDIGLQIGTCVNY